MTERVSVHLKIKHDRCTHINAISWSKKSGVQQSGKTKMLSEFQFEVGLRCALGHRLSSIRQDRHNVIKEWVVIS